MLLNTSRLEEEVGGVIIGGDEPDYYYQFWAKGDNPRLIISTHAGSDADAVAWFKEHCPAAFKAGAEMRVFA